MSVESILKRTLVKYPLFGSVVANTNFIADQDIETAATDGKNIYYNPSFIESITDKQQVFVFAHEISHIAFNHIFRSEGKDEYYWNIATDSVINAFLKQDGLPMIEGAVDIEEALNYDAEEMYNKLLDENKNEQNNKPENHDVGHDTHSMWPKAIERKHQEEQEKKANKHQHDNKSDNENNKRLPELGEKEVFKQNKIERKKQLDRLRNELASQSHGYGSDTNSEKINITDIGTSIPLINWRVLLKEAVKYDIDWSYQNAYIEDGLVTPYLEEIPRPETEIILDTSGSINKTLLRNFLRECKNILQTSKVKVGCFDTKFYGFTEIKDMSDIDNLPLCGGGGTNFNVAVNAFTRRVENKIIFTDGDAPMPNTSIDAIWIVFGGKKINPLGGKVIYIDDNELESLYNCQMNYEEKSRLR